MSGKVEGAKMLRCRAEALVGNVQLWGKTTCLEGLKEASSSGTGKCF
jgi:hypothetical protein